VLARRTIDEVLDQARSRLQRLSAHEAALAQRDGALLVDIRPEVNRQQEGRLPGAMVCERIHLEWRFDPASDACLPEASYDAHVIVVCNEGWASSLAAAALRDLGVRRATDMIGGFRGWKAVGLPVNEAESAP
jgi:rhodanese-related sulfurtransferase